MKVELMTAIPEPQAVLSCMVLCGMGLFVRTRRTATA